jgi:hypothetical protein
MFFMRANHFLGKDNGDHIEVRVRDFNLPGLADMELAFPSS